MTHDHASHPQSVQSGGFRRSHYAIGLLVLGTVAGYFLWVEHRAHLTQWWPYALVLACPLMHVFMHKGHGGHSSGPGVHDKGTGQDFDRS
ncbi:MAG: DUF2933 domain-containing protein [Burkholderiaceae bacterium]|jgi:hypothetical protein|nr:DUF2933 domain-containing protein [Burkholderiaceae bacterium]MEB2317751.1 DUF2933 domain-containing protein [Pseudomonadota bacterium]